MELSERYMQMMRSLRGRRLSFRVNLINFKRQWYNNDVFYAISPATYSTVRLTEKKGADMKKEVSSAPIRAIQCLIYQSFNRKYRECISTVSCARKFSTSMKFKTRSQKKCFGRHDDKKKVNAQRRFFRPFFLSRRAPGLDKLSL